MRETVEERLAKIFNIPHLVIPNGVMFAKNTLRDWIREQRIATGARPEIISIPLLAFRVMESWFDPGTTFPHSTESGARLKVIVERIEDKYGIKMWDNYIQFDGVFFIYD